MLRFVPSWWAEWLARGQPRRLGQALIDNARLFGVRPHPHLSYNARHALAAVRHPTLPMPGWLQPEFVIRTGVAGRAGWLARPRGADLDSRSLTRLPFWTTVFSWCDPSFTGLPIRYRHPLADLRVLDFIARLAPEPWLMRKRILRTAARGLLPEEILVRPKTPLVQARRTSISPMTMGRLAEARPESPRVAALLRGAGTGGGGHGSRCSLGARPESSPDAGARAGILARALAASRRFGDGYGGCKGSVEYGGVGEEMTVEMDREAGATGPIGRSDSPTVRPR